MGYKKLFWGFIFLFDFRISGFDVVPDFIGYILFYSGLTMLEEKNDYFRKAKRFAFPMIFISVLDLYQVPMQINNTGSSSLGILSILVGFLTTIVGLLMVYNICLGIANEAQLIDNLGLESKANNTWKLYLGINVVLLVGMLLPGLLGVFFIVLIILSIVSYLQMLHLMNSAAYQLE
jgi:hypothetical protein